MVSDCRNNDLPEVGYAPNEPTTIKHFYNIKSP